MDVLPSSKRWLLSLLAISFLLTTPVVEAAIPPYLLRKAEPRPIKKSLPIEKNAAVRRWIRHFSEKDRERFDRFMTRGAIYKTLIQDILIEHGVPAEMYYLAMIESGFVRHARSHAEAVGIWQFIEGTATRYGLRADHAIDERLDIIRATRAASRYLRDLYDEFGSWNLAMAAYNCGEGRVRAAVAKAKTKNFWTLARLRLLPRETVQYIPKFQAAMIIARNPKRYGFEQKTFYEYPEVRLVRVPASTPLAKVASKYRVPLDTVKALNPHVLKSKTPKGKRGYHVWIPTQTRKRI